VLTIGYVRTMAAYNAELNRRLYGAAARLGDAARQADGGAFWRSIEGTFRHLLWADQMWMSRLAGWADPGVKLAQSDEFGPPGFAALAARRADMDGGLVEWSRGIDPDWLDGELSWWSGSMQRDITRPRWMVLAHLFNHQTHHRGQAHALLTRAGERTGDTDLVFVVDPE